MQILYCEDCGTRVDESESVLIGGKVYCAQCAPKVPASVSTPAPGTKTMRRSVRQTVTPGGGKAAQTGRVTPSPGVRNMSINPPSGFYVDTSLPHRQPEAPPVPPLMGWYQRNTALAVALGAGMVGVVCLILWSLFSSPPPKEVIKRQPPIEAPPIPTKTVPVVTTPATVTSQTTDKVWAGPAFMAPENEDMGLKSAKDHFSDLKKMVANDKLNRFDVRRRVDDYVKSNQRYKKEEFYKEALKLQAGIPKSDQRPPDDATGAQPGLTAVATFKDVDSVYRADYKPEKKYSFKQIDIPNEKELKKLTDHETNIALRFVGFIEIPANATYTFYLSSDDGSVLRIGDSIVVDHGGNHAMTERSGTLPMKAGKHSFRVDYFQGTGQGGLTLSWSGPNIDKQIIPDSAFSSKPIP